MSPAAAALLQQAAQLDPADRAELLDALWRLDPTPPHPDEVAEVERRLAEYEAGRMPSVSLEESNAQVQALREKARSIPPV